MDEQEQRDADMLRVRETCNALMEHFDSVQIFATRHEAGELSGTVQVDFGRGNWFARRGQIHDWCVKEDEVTRQQARQVE